MKTLNGYKFKDVYDYYEYMSQCYMNAPKYDDLTDENKQKFLSDYEALKDTK